MLSRFFRYTPLTYLSDDTILLYKKGKIYCYNFLLKKIELYATFPFSFLYDILAYSRFLSRLLRIDVRIGLKYSTNKCLLVRGGFFYSLDLKERILSKGNRISKGNYPLNIVEIVGLSGFTDGVYFGDYFYNPLKDTVNIWIYISEKEQEIVYTFPKGQVNHIHGLIPDNDNNCIWILTGDFDDAAAIWKATNNFDTLELVLSGNQDYRTCVAFPYDKGLLYCTDSPFKTNSLYYLLRNNEKWEIKKIMDINGPVIYGGMYKQKYLFSTSVEPDGRFNRFRNLITRVRGQAILDDYSYLYYGDMEGGINVVARYRKDVLPFGLFQFGAIRFPTNMHIASNLLMYCIGTKKNDLSSILFNDNV